MRILITSLITVAMAGLLTSLSTTKTDAVASFENEHYILLELFTSQGCSSCPPADRVLKRLKADAEQGDLSVVALSYHVDYWNRLGWKDPYSQKAFSERQYTYADKLGDNRVYTPELVINGTSGHIGSRELEIRNKIQKISKGLNYTTFEVAFDQNSKGISYQFDKAPADMLLQVALVQPVVANEVPRGENTGRRLEHVQVVDQLITVESPNQIGQVELASYSKDQEVIVFLQDKNTWAIRGVQKL